MYISAHKTLSWGCQLVTHYVAVDSGCVTSDSVAKDWLSSPAVLQVWHNIDGWRICACAGAAPGRARGRLLAG